MNSKLTLLTVLVGMVVGSSSRVKGPPVAERRQERHVAREGEEVKLKCPIQGHPTPMVTWTRDGDVIDFSWTRFRTNKRNLKIRGVAKEDRGLYKCKGINGFGSAEVALELLVMGEKELEGLEQGDLEHLAPPAFLTVEESEVMQAEGEEVVLDCSVTGYPRPSILWYRGGALLREGGSRLVVPGSGSGEGDYSCRATNLVGSLQRQFSVVKVEPTAEPTNLSVDEGNSATLDCRVRSAITPSIRWLKKLEMEEEGALSVGRDFYRMLDSNQETVIAGVGEYLSQLVLHETEPSDTGMYICFVTSPRGRFNFQPSYLTVLKSNSVATEGVEETPILVLVVCISIIATLMLIGAAACLVQRRQKPPASPPPSVVISNTSTSPEKPVMKRGGEGSSVSSSERQAARLEELLREQAQPLAQAAEPRYFIQQPGEYLGQEYHTYRGADPDFRVYSPENMIEQEYRAYSRAELQNLYEVPSVPRTQYSAYSSGPPRHQSSTYSLRR